MSTIAASGAAAAKQAVETATAFAQVTAARRRWVPNRNDGYWRSQRKEQVATKLYHRNLKLSAGAKNEYDEPLYTKQSWPIVTGDMVEVVTNARRRMINAHKPREKSKGMRGRVIRVLRKTHQVIVEGVNMRTRVAQPTAEQAGHFYKLESPINYAHIRLIDPATGIRASKLVHVGRVRVTDTGVIIPKPWVGPSKDATRKDAPPSPANPLSNPLVDTQPDAARSITYRRPAILRPAVRAEMKMGKPVMDQFGRIALIPEGMELKTARMKF